MKPKILFVVDSPDWAFHNIAKEIQSKFSKEYEMYTDFADLFTLQIIPKLPLWKFCLKNIKALLLIIRGTIFKRYRRPVAVYLQNRTRVKQYVPSSWKFVLLRNLPVKRYILPYKRKYDLIIHMSYYFQFRCNLPHRALKKVVGIYTECYPHSGYNYDLVKSENISRLSREVFIKEYISHYDCLIVGSNKLLETYRKYLSNVYLVNAIYKESDFRVWKNSEKFFSSKLVLGWTGNPGRDFKGYFSIIEPAIQKVKKSGILIELKTQFSGTYESLIDFYDDVACVVITSSADTGPSMFSEASLSGIPSISTRVGFPLMVIENNKNGLFIEREIDALVEAIEYIYNNRPKLFSMAKIIRSDYLEKLGNNKLTADFSKVLLQ